MPDDRTCPLCARTRLVVEEIREQYPEDVFPPESTSPDSAGARFARHLCDVVLDAMEGEVSDA